MITLHTLSVDEIARRDLSPVRDRFPERWADAHRRRSERDRLLCLGAGLLLADVLQIPDGSCLHKESFGRPYADGFPPFSLSHSGDLCVLAVNGGEAGASPVGVDTEQLVPRDPHRLRRLLLPEEQVWADSVRAADPSGQEGMVFLRAFYTLWTLKESVIKACGRGLSLDPRRLCVLPLTEGGCITAAGEDWCAVTLEQDGHIISVCTAERDRTALPLPGPGPNT